MSLTTNDLSDIKNIVESALVKQTEEAIKPLHGEIEALSNDVKEIYQMISDMQKDDTRNTTQENLNVEQQLLQLHSDLVEAARQAGVKLPSH